MPANSTSVIDQAKLVAEQKISARELVDHALEVIGRHNPDLRAFVTVLTDEAKTQAAELDEHLAKTGAPLGPLHGVPMAIKDELDVAGVRTSLGTNAVSKPATSDCEAVRRLRAAGAIIIGKTAMPEFGQWPFTESTTNGYTRNPWNRRFSAAGSSGGTAAAVASGMVAAGMGGDGGGSIRLPAAWCGLFGAKMQRGRISVAPNRTLWRSLGVIGPLTTTVADSALLNDLLAGHLPSDAYAAEPWPTTLSAAIQESPRPLRVLIAPQPADGSEITIELQTLNALYRVAETLEQLGHHVESGKLPTYRPGLAMTAQMAGGVTDEFELIDSVRLLESRTRAAAPLYRLLAPLSAGAERRAKELEGEIFGVFDTFDVVLTPTAPHPALPVGQLDGKGLIGTMRAALPMISYTAIWNVLGNPAAALPAGFTANGLPLSVQLIVAPHQEPLLFQVAAQLERELPWADRRPPLAAPTDSA